MLLDCLGPSPDKYTSRRQRPPPCEACISNHATPTPASSQKLVLHKVLQQLKTPSETEAFAAGLLEYHYYKNALKLIDVQTCISVLQMVLETRAGLEAGVVSSGHAMAAARLDAQRSIAGWASEQIGGLSYLNYVRELSQRIDSDWEGIQQDLEVGMLLVMSAKQPKCLPSNPSLPCSC